MEIQSRSCLKALLVLNLFIAGSLASYRNGKSRYQQEGYGGCNHSALVPAEANSQLQDDEAIVVEIDATTEIPTSTPSTTNFPQNNYFSPVILGPQDLKKYQYDTSVYNRPTFVGNRMQTFNFGGNRFSVNSIGGGNDIKEERVPTLRPGANRLAQFQQSVASVRNSIQGNRFFDLGAAGSSRFVLFTRDAYLSATEANVIVADFSTFETFLLFWSNLPVFASKRVADLITFLELTKGAKREDFHIIARSYGTHVAGVTGRLLQGRVGRITGLEPEPKLYGNDDDEFRVIHVNGRRYFFHGARFGLQPPSGHVDIYPHYSEKNTGCPGTANNYGRFNFGFCQRGRGVSYFTETIKYPAAHSMCQCKSYYEYKSGICTYTEENSKFYLGEYLNNQTRGVFQLAVPTYNPSWNRVLQVLRQASRL